MVVDGLTKPLVGAKHSLCYDVWSRLIQMGIMCVYWATGGYLRIF